MIARTSWLLRSASFKELFGFVLISVVAASLIGVAGSLMMAAVHELVKARPALDGAYLVEVFGVLWPVLYALVGVFVAFKNYQTLQDTIARCELAEDEMAWINRHSDYERMIEDRELMRLAANVGRVCRTYTATHSLFERFLDDYRTLINEYGWVLDETIQEARIELLNDQAEEGLERYAARVRREGMRKEREGS